MQRRFSRALHFKLVQVHHRSRYLVREAGGCEETAGEGRRAGEISSREIIRCVEVERKAKEKTGVWRVSGILSTTRTEESGGAALYS